MAYDSAQIIFATNKKQSLCAARSRFCSTLKGTKERIRKSSRSIWEVKDGRAKGKSLEADRINRHLDNIRTQIGKHYQEICDRESYVSAEKVKNAFLGLGEKYRLLLEAFEKFTADLQKRVGIDRSHGTWKRYHKSIDHLRAFMRKEYSVSDRPLVELEMSFIEQYHVYLKTAISNDYIPD